MTENNSQEPEKHIERPLECTECRKPIAVHYTEILGSVVTHTYMCADCPVLRRRLHGAPHAEQQGGFSEAVAGLACGNCGTTLEELKVSNILGCNICYEVFDDVLIQEMLVNNKIPARVVSGIKKSTPVHIGRSPGEIQEISPSLRLLALNEALNEMLKTEDYEQAAWLRDQIKELTEKPYNSSGKTDDRKK